MGRWRWLVVCGHKLEDMKRVLEEGGGSSDDEGSSGEGSGTSSASNPPEATRSSASLQWNGEVDSGFLTAHAAVGMPLGAKRGGTIASYRTHLPACSDGVIYGRASFWKAHLPSGPADAAVYAGLRALGAQGLEASPRKKKKTKTSKPGNGPFSADEDKIYIKLLQLHGKPNKSNQPALAAFAKAFPDRSEPSWKAHQNCFEQSDDDTWQLTLTQTV